MAIDLSGLKVGTAWRVRTSYDSGVLFVRGPEGHKQFVVQYDQRDGWDSFKETGLGVGGIHRIEQILHELKPVADITAADLDGRVIETDDGGYVFFADGHACVYCPNHGGDWGFSGMFAGWFDEAGDKPEDLQAAYAAELDRRRNPPVVIQWQGECRDEKGIRLQGWCEVRGDQWRFSMSQERDYYIYRSHRIQGCRPDIAGIEELIRDHYASKDRAAEPV